MRIHNGSLPHPALDAIRGIKSISAPFHLDRRVFSGVLLPSHFDIQRHNSHMEMQIHGPNIHKNFNVAKHKSII
jgi:hypothetical protein